MNQKLLQYIEEKILPRYAAFDKAHREDHARQVIARSLALARHYSVDPDMVLAAAAFHDLGLEQGRERHHLVSGRIIREDPFLRTRFTPEQIETIAQAAEDHRASAGNEPRSLYGRIIAEADRLIDGTVIIRRTIQYGLTHYPELDREGHWQRFLQHMREKYDEGGYLRLWIPESDNAASLRDFRALLKDRAALRDRFDALFDEESARK